MKKFILILLVALIALVALAGAMTFVLMDDGSDSGVSSEAYQKVSHKVQEVTSSDSGSSGSSSGSSNDGGSNIVSELVKSNDQEGEGSYREVNYNDGGFRQYDTESGKLIGSSYEEDQEQLGVVDGNLE